MVFKLIGEPVESLVQAVSTRGTRSLDVPVPVAQRVQAQFIRELCSVHSVWQVLGKKK